MGDYPVIKINNIPRKEVIYSGADITQANINNIFPEVPKDNQQGSGVYAVIQYIIKWLLTERGSNSYDSTYGCSLMAYKGASVNNSMIRDLYSELASLIPIWMDRIREIEEELNSSEKDIIQQIAIADLKFDIATSSLILKILLKTGYESFPITVTTNG